jgi:hypothetical protein
MPMATGIALNDTISATYDSEEYKQQALLI